MNLDKIRYDRLSEPEKFLLEIFDGLEESTIDGYTDIIFYKKDNIVLFKYYPKLNVIYYSYWDIKKIIIDKFNYNDNINILVKSVFEHEFNLKVNTSTFFY